MTIRTLLADDHEMVREGLRLILEKNRDIAIVGVAGDGREAVRMARELRPEVVVLDIAMPEVSGIEACRLILEDLPEAKVVILSMHSAPEYVYRALANGALGFIVKAATGSELAEAVRAVHSGKRFLSRKIAESVVDEYIRQGAPPVAADPLARLSPREREVLRLVVAGKSSREIAALIHVSASTVDTYRSRVLQKLDVANLAALVKFAIEHGIVPPP